MPLTVYFTSPHAPRPLSADQVPPLAVFTPQFHPVGSALPTSRTHAEKEHPVATNIIVAARTCLGSGWGFSRFDPFRLDPFSAPFCETVVYFFLIMGLTQNGSKSPRVFSVGPHPQQPTPDIRNPVLRSGHPLCWLGLWDVVAGRMVGVRCTGGVCMGGRNIKAAWNITALPKGFEQSTPDNHILLPFKGSQVG